MTTAKVMMTTVLMMVTLDFKLSTFLYIIKSVHKILETLQTGNQSLEFLWWLEFSNEVFINLASVLKNNSLL